MVTHYLSILTELKQSYSSSLETANNILTRSIDHTGERVVDLIYSLLQETIMKLIEESSSTSKNIVKIIKIGHERMDELST